MRIKYWAKRGKKQVGPFATREEALEAFRATYPHKGPDYMARAKRNQILTGYGEHGAYGDMQWFDAKKVEGSRL